MRLLERPFDGSRRNSGSAVGRVSIRKQCQTGVRPAKTVRVTRASGSAIGDVARDSLTLRRFAGAGCPTGQSVEEL